jgi:AraC-like DNA-binding protein
MTRPDLSSRVTAILSQAGVAQGALAHEASATHLLIHPAPTPLDASVYRPLFCAVLQGAKEVGTGARTLTVRAGQSLIVSHAVPVVSRITEATARRPYVALVLPLDLELLRRLAPEAPPPPEGRASDLSSIRLSDTEAELEDALTRHLLQCETEAQRRLLAPITMREIHARLLLGRHAEGLRRLLRHDDAASRIFRATRAIQSDLAEPLVVGELARHVGLSSSAFFERFKAVTGTSPLQYQKDLRLLKARDALRTSGAKVSKIAFDVGYENPAQFSREYARKFGRSPRRDRVADPAE